MFTSPFAMGEDTPSDTVDLASFCFLVVAVCMAGIVDFDGQWPY